VNANFNAHGMDVDLDIRAVELDVDITGIKFDMTYCGANFQYTYTGVDIIYENAAKRYLILDRPEFRISDDNLKTLTKESIESVAGESIILQVESNADLMGMPEKVMGGESKYDAGDFIPMAAWYRALTGSSQDAEDKFDEVMTNTDFNSPRTSEVKRKKESYSRLDIDKESIGFASFADSKSLAELVLNSKKKLIELNVREPGTKPTDFTNNMIQSFNLDKKYYYLTSYIDKDRFGKTWIAAEAKADEYTKNSAGMMIQAADKKLAKTILDAEDSYINNAVQVKEDQSAISHLDAKNEIIGLDLINGEKTSEILMNNKTATGAWSVVSGGKEFELSYKAGSFAKLRIKDSDESSIEVKKDAVNIKTKKLTVEPTDLATIKSKKVVLKSDHVDVGGCDFKSSSVKIPKATVTLGSSNTVKISSTGVALKGTKISISGTGIAEVKGSMIKIG